METSDRLTQDEIEALRSNRIELHEYCQRLFREPKPDQAKKPYYLTQDEIDALRAKMKASSEWMEQELRRRYPNRIRTHKD